MGWRSFRTGPGNGHRLPPRSRVRGATAIGHPLAVDSHAITAVTPASTASSVPAAADILTLMAGRSVSVSFTVGVR